MVMVFLMPSLYRVIVEKVTSRQRRATTSSFQPCGLADNELMEYMIASRQGVACYIAAEIVSVDEDDDQPFIVGDGKMYGGFYNAPLEQDHIYRVWLGFIVTVDGVYHFMMIMMMIIIIFTPGRYIFLKGLTL